MVSMTKQMNFFVTNTEIEALLLECNLIKRHKPRFNIILRDDKSFPYILINKEYEFPRILKYRGQKNTKENILAPLYLHQLLITQSFLYKKLFYYAVVRIHVFNNRTRPCLLYDIKRCSAPCVKYISKKNYDESIQDAKKFLNGNTKKIESKLNKLMTSMLVKIKCMKKLEDYVIASNQ